jgi:DNA-binding MarR family transcriptional regulator
MKSHAVSVLRDFPSSQAPRPARRGTRTSADAETGQFVDGYLPALLAQAHDLVSGEFHAVAAEHGIAPSEWRVLATLASGVPMSIGRLAQIVVMKQPTVTRLLDRMEAVGHVQRLPHDGDRRITLVGITPAGQKVVSKLLALAREHEERVLEPFGAERAADLKDTLLQLIALHRGVDDA